MRLTHREMLAASLAEPEAFWAAAAAEISWSTRPSIVLDRSETPFDRWFPDGVLNACYNAVDRHVEAGNGERIALIHDSAITGQSHQLTYRALQDQVARIAGMLQRLGVSKGDRVLIYMPMIAEALMAMLACARLGAIHSVVFGGFAAHELAVRIDDAEPVVVLAASCGLEAGRVVAYKPLLDRALSLATHSVRCCVLLQRPQAIATLIEGRDVDWNTCLSEASPVPCEPVAANHPLYILYTSGTTGQPKGVVHDTGGYLVALSWSMEKLYDIQPGEVFWAASDVGWVVGHSYICYGPLVAGATTVMYEGKPVGTPDAGAFWRVISEHRVKALFTAPTAFRAIRKEDPEGTLIRQYDISSLETLFLAGERCDPETLLWAAHQLQVPVIDHWWQTETGWAICANLKGVGLMPVKPGSPTLPVPGYALQVLDERGDPRPSNQLGSLVLKCPLPPGCFTTLWNDEQRCRQAYYQRFPGYYETGDAGYIDDDGYAFVMSRTDDVINVAGHRLSTGAMEEVLAQHPAVAECAVMGVADALKGQVPLGLLVLKAGVSLPGQRIIAEAIALVREQIGPVAAFKLCAVVPRLPKTRSGKILRATMRAIADGRDWTMPATIDDPAILDEIAEALSQMERQ